MIFGIGTDLLEVARVAETYEKFGEHFVERLLLEEERVFFERTERKVRFLAMHFAAKEAIVKAMGTGFSNGVWIRDTGFVPDRRGKPVVVFSARGRRVCDRIGAGEAFVSLTDEAGLISAFAVLERANLDE